METNVCHIGDVLDILPTLPDGCIQTCVTSPPYWGLRDYGTATWEGGDADCEHRAPLPGDYNASTYHDVATAKRKIVERQQQFREECRHCGARRIDSQLGLETTPEEYVATMVRVFREVRRVLREDGTCWVNLGDSYAGNGGGASAWSTPLEQQKKRANNADLPRREMSGLKPKDLIGIPWRVAFALQADGWYLRQDIVWSKSNPMPESVTDRCTKAHEYVFLLSKSARYFFDADAIREPHVDFARGEFGDRVGGDDSARAQLGVRTGTFNIDRAGASRAYNPAGRNRRSVWTIPSEPYPDAHFATFPRALVEPCIMAGSRPGDVVLDPFMGSGTTAQVAQDLGRQWIGCELNPEYVAMQQRRTAQQALAL